MHRIEEDIAEIEDRVAVVCQMSHQRARGRVEQAAKDNQWKQRVHRGMERTA